jgi:hypothetical protein
MKKYTLLFLFIPALFLKCSFIDRTVYGAKKPKTENYRSIYRWLQRNNFDPDNAVTVSPDHFYDFVPKLFDSPLLFDQHTGTFLAVGFSNGKYCPKGVDKTLMTIKPFQGLFSKPDSFIISEYVSLPSGASLKEVDKYEKQKDTAFLNLNELKTYLRTLNGDTASQLFNSDRDYILILPFTLYFGNRLQVSELKKYYKAALGNKNSRIKVIFLNLDKQQWWGEEWNKKINIII